MCDDDDFHFDFDDDIRVDEPLYMVYLDGDMIVGHLTVDHDNVTWMNRPYHVIAEDTDEGAILIERPRFKIDYSTMEVIIVMNAEEVRAQDAKALLSIGCINGTLFMCDSTRH